MKKTTPEESRKILESVTTPFHIGFFAVFMLVSTFAFLFGLFTSLETISKTKVDPNLLMLAVGLAGFLFSFPVMVSLYVARIVLSRLRELEDKQNQVA
jgi:nitrate reductase gamma subunit